MVKDFEAWLVLVILPLAAIISTIAFNFKQWWQYTFCLYCRTNRPFDCNRVNPVCKDCRKKYEKEFTWED